MTKERTKARSLPLIVDPVSLNPSEEVHIGSLLHLVNILILHDLFIVEQDPRQPILAGQCLANESHIMPWIC